MLFTIGLAGLANAADWWIRPGVEPLSMAALVFVDAPATLALWCAIVMFVAIVVRNRLIAALVSLALAGLYIGVFFRTPVYPDQQRSGVRRCNPTAVRSGTAVPVLAERSAPPVLRRRRARAARFRRGGVSPARRGSTQPAVDRGHGNGCARRPRHCQSDRVGNSGCRTATGVGDGPPGRRRHTASGPRNHLRQRANRPRTPPAHRHRSRFAGPRCRDRRLAVLVESGPRDRGTAPRRLAGRLRPPKRPC